MKQPESFTLSAADGEALLARLSVYAPTRCDCEILMLVVRWYFWLMFALQETKITLSRLRRLLFGKALKPSPASEEATTPTAGGGEEPRSDSVVHADAATSGDSPPPSQSTPPAKPKGAHRAGTGRLEADAYVGAERVECRHDDLAAGQRCPVCGQGSLYDLPPGVEIRIDGHALLSAIRYELHKLRCSACGAIFTAPLPDGVGKTKYSPRARAALVVSRYY
jgi:hypothetical protein